MKKDIELLHHKTFEETKQIDKDGNEFWYARALAKLLDYADFRNFQNVINKAKEACKNSGFNPDDHLVEITEVVQIGSGAKTSYPSFALSRYACYLIVQNADPSKPVVASGQTYFAIQTRRAELQNDEVFARLKKSHKILDYMGSTELAANLFRATQTEEKLKRDNIKGKIKANQTHFEVGKKVRDTIKELGGIMPEELPTPKERISKIEQSLKRIEDTKDKT